MIVEKLTICEMAAGMKLRFAIDNIQSQFHNWLELSGEMIQR
jgi:hypothetical protein